MARRKKGLTLEEDEATIDISSMIDVCFLLLIYFMVTSKIAEPESDLKINLPGENPSTAPSEIEPLYFKVSSNGEINQVEADSSLSSMSGPGKTDLTSRCEGSVCH